MITKALTTGLGSGGADAAHAQAGWLVAAALTARQHKGGFTDPVNDNLLPVSYGFSKASHPLGIRELAEPITCRNSDPGQVAICFTERTRDGQRQIEAIRGQSYALMNPGQGGRAQERQIAGPFGVRRLTPRECERLQGFPDDWTRYDQDGAELSDTARYRMLGNAVPVPVVQWLAQRLGSVDYEQQNGGMA